MNLVVFGEDMYTAAVVQSLVQAGHKISLMIAPDNPNTNFKVLEETSGKFNLEFIKAENINSEKIKERILKVNPDLIIAAHLRKLLRKEIFSIAAKGAINIHPSLLPKYRGLSPQHQALIHGDEESGVTVHFIDEYIDTGEIILQKKFPILKEDYIIDVQTKMLNIYKEIVVEAVNLLADGNFKPIKQDLATLSYFGPLKKSDREIQLSMSKKEAYNLIRAVSLPYKGAFYKNYTIYRSSIIEDQAELENKYPEIGLYPEGTGDKIIIRLKDGFLVSDDFEIN